MITPGTIVRTKHLIPNRNPGRPPLPAGLHGVVTALNGPLALVECDPDDLPPGVPNDPPHVMLPVESVEPAGNPVLFSVSDWDLVVAIQREVYERDVPTITAYRVALEYHPLNKNGRS